MSWIKWAAGLVFFDVLLIVLVISFGSSGYDVADYDYNSTINEVNSTTDATWSSLNWFDKLSISFNNMPSWANWFLIVYNAILIGLIVYAGIRGLS